MTDDAPYRSPGEQPAGRSQRTGAGAGSQRAARTLMAAATTLAR